MVKIPNSDSRDRIIFVTETTSVPHWHRGRCHTCITGAHRLYYLPVGSKPKDAYFLFETAYSPSVNAFFAKAGRLCYDTGCQVAHTMTISELHNVKNFHHNFKLSHLMHRIPAHVSYVNRFERGYQPAATPAHLSSAPHTLQPVPYAR